MIISKKIVSVSFMFFLSRDQKPGSTATYNGKCYIFNGQQPKNFIEAKGMLTRAYPMVLIYDGNS